tara:strand:- start:28 stop:282 length:255 start_codon:yes stop_codon:yes gene_type:complete
MNIEKMLKDTVDQQNHARWTGAIYALTDLTSYMTTLLKTEGCTHKSFSEDMVHYVGEELKRYRKLSETTEIGKKMKDIGDKYGT